MSFLHKKNTPEKDISNYTNEEKSKEKEVYVYLMAVKNVTKIKAKAKTPSILAE